MNRNRTLLSITVFFCFLCSITAKSRYAGIPWPERIPIPIYDSPISYIPASYFIQSETTDSDTDYNWYDAEILDSSEQRFKINLYVDSDGINIRNRICWINKSNMVVTPLVNSYEENIGYVTLYLDETCTTSKKIDISIMPQVVTLLAYDIINGKPYAKITFEINNNVYVGWISRFCDNTSQSCN